MEEIIETLMEKLQDMVNQKIKDELKKFQDITNKKLKKKQKWTQRGLWLPPKWNKTNYKKKGYLK
jgi:hypothetical protein